MFNMDPKSAALKITMAKRRYNTVCILWKNVSITTCVSYVPKSRPALIIVIIIEDIRKIELSKIDGYCSQQSYFGFHRIQQHFRWKEDK